jgi:hypothetical protein
MEAMLEMVCSSSRREKEIRERERERCLTERLTEIAFDCMKAAYDAGINVSRTTPIPLVSPPRLLLF